MKRKSILIFRANQAIWWFKSLLPKFKKWLKFKKAINSLTENDIVYIHDALLCYRDERLAKRCQERDFYSRENLFDDAFEAEKTERKISNLIEA